MSSAWVPLGALGPQFRDSRMMVERIDVAPGPRDDWRAGTFVTLEQPSFGGRFVFMVSELPAFVERLHALVPVVEQLAALKEEEEEEHVADKRVGRSEEVAEGVLRRLFDGRTGHGQGPCSYRQLRREDVRAFAIAAYEIGYLDGKKAKEGKDGR